LGAEVVVIVTALGAVLVFVITQSFLKLVLEPVQEQRRLIGEVASALTVYEKSFMLRVEPSEGTFGAKSMLFGATKEEAMEADKALRGLAGRLRGSLWTVPAYDMFAFLRLVPKLVDVVVAANELQMWYSQLPQPVNEHQAARIRECRNIISKSLGIERRLQVISPPLEAPQEAARESSETATEKPEGTSPWSDALGPQTGAQRPWWRRLLGD
jgi:hypothetical protein